MSDRERPTQEDRDEQEFLYALTIHVAIQLKARAEAMVAHAATHKAVSKTIIDSVINGKQYIAAIWDARKAHMGRPVRSSSTIATQS